MIVKIYKYDENFKRSLVYMRECRSVREAIAVRDTACVVMDCAICVEIVGGKGV